MGGRNSRHTGCKVIKRIMTKDLATTYSLTGLGYKRKRVKNSFKDHPIANVVVGESILVRLWSTYRVHFCQDQDHEDQDHDGINPIGMYDSSNETS